MSAIKRLPLIEARKARDLSQSALAKKVGTYQQMIDRLEQGQPPTYHLALAIATFLETPLEELFPDIKRQPQTDVETAAFIKPLRNKAEGHWILQIEFEAGQVHTISIGSDTLEEIRPHLGDDGGVLKVQSDTSTYLLNMHHVGKMKISQSTSDIEVDDFPANLLAILYGTEREPVYLQLPLVGDGEPKDLLDKPKIVFEEANGNVLVVKREKIAMIAIPNRKS